MREALKPLWFLLKVSAILAISAYPVTLIIQLFSKTSKPFTQYNQMISYVFGEYWDWMIVVVLSLIFLRSDIFFRTVDLIRNRHYELEFLRWKNTPYISPLHLYYLLSPPGATTADKQSNAFDPLYKKVVNDFRDRIYINAKFTSFEPEPKPSLTKILGRPIVSQLVVNSLMILAGFIGMLYLNPITGLFNGWGKAFIPIEVLFLSRNIQIINAIRAVHPSKTYERIKQLFGQEEPKLTWRELFPDTPYGESILFAWKSDCEKRQRLAYEISNKPVPAKMEFTSPGLAPKPFPSDEIPEWVDDAARSYEEQKWQWMNQIQTINNRELEKSTHGKVVAFIKNKRK